MPLYEYLCRSCDKPFEALVFGGDTPACPTCQGTDLEKQLSAFAVGNGDKGSPAPMAAGGCGSCGHPDGPGACRMN